MKLSFCIPTYNRSEFLKKNLEILVSQIKELSMENAIEICISDNASTDFTQTICENIKQTNPDINFLYQRNSSNEGPDRNFIKAMNLAHGEFSILFGDDDYLINGALKTILEIIKHPNISIFLFNRKCIDTKGNIVSEAPFIKSSHKTKTYDYSNEDSIISHFNSMLSLGGALTFISSVIYKTEILKKYQFDESVIGSNYAFLFYWWNELLSGNSLYYYNSPLVLATTTGNTNNNYGKLVKRIFVDYNGFQIIANTVFKYSSYKELFLHTVDKEHLDFELYSVYFQDKKNFESLLLPVLKKYYWSDSKYRLFKELTNPLRIIKMFIRGFILRKKII